MANNVVKDAQGKAVTKYIRISPLKVRGVANEIRGKNVREALGILKFTPRKAASYLKKTLESAISKTYGKCERTDILMPDSSWDDPKYWMESIENKERYFFTSWTKESGAMLPKDMVGIYMGICANSSLSGYICLEYEFSNHEAVTKAATEAEDSTL